VVFVGLWICPCDSLWLLGLIRQGLSMHDSKVHCKHGIGLLSLMEECLVWRC
ncbi:hypothetical protein L9F63_011940, partial [Diploptera punctata]